MQAIRWFAALAVALALVGGADAAKAKKKANKPVKGVVEKVEGTAEKGTLTIKQGGKKAQQAAAAGQADKKAKKAKKATGPQTVQVNKETKYTFVAKGKKKNQTAQAAQTKKQKKAAKKAAPAGETKKASFADVKQGSKVTVQVSAGQAKQVDIVKAKTKKKAKKTS